jgi:probable rRNA maturation factor
MAITFNTADIKFSLRSRVALRGFMESQIRKFGNSEARKLNLSFVFCSDEYLLGINRQFLQHDYYTDIITFPLSDSQEELEAEIYISVDRVRENSLQFAVRGSQKIPDTGSQEPKHLFQRELHRVIFHGVLHLLGYKDKTKANQLEMRKMEDLWLKRFADDGSQLTAVKAKSRKLKK